MDASPYDITVASQKDRRGRAKLTSSYSPNVNYVITMSIACRTEVLCVFSPSSSASFLAFACRARTHNCNLMCERDIKKN